MIFQYNRCSDPAVFVGFCLSKKDSLLFLGKRFLYKLVYISVFSKSC